MVKTSPANKLTNQILQFLYKQGVYCWRQNSGGIFDIRKGIYRTGAKKGVSDILGCIPPKGRLIAIEVKIGKDRLSDEQVGFMRNIIHAGGIAFIATDYESFLSSWEKELST